MQVILKTWILSKNLLNYSHKSSKYFQEHKETFKSSQNLSLCGAGNGQAAAAERCAGDDRGLVALTSAAAARGAGKVRSMGRRSAAGAELRAWLAAWSRRCRQLPAMMRSAMPRRQLLAIPPAVIAAIRVHSLLVTLDEVEEQQLVRDVARPNCWLNVNPLSVPPDVA